MLWDLSGFCIIQTSELNGSMMGLSACCILQVFKGVTNLFYSLSMKIFLIYCLDLISWGGGKGQF